MRNSSAPPTRGFTLVVTLALMILLMIIAIGVLSLSTISLRSTSRSQAMSTARANARLALMLAIGDLQKHAGPDQRITAPAAILDAVAETEALENVGEPNVTGVWSSHQQTAGQLPTIPSYDKPRSFRRWLVSGLSEADATRSTTLSESPFRKSNTGVVLVGQKTTEDSNPNSATHLWAGKIAMHAAGASSPIAGHGAYAVMDEGTKARIDLATPASMTNDERSRLLAGTPARHAFDLIPSNNPRQGPALDAYFDVRSNTARAITLASAPLLKSGLPALRKYFQDFTTDSAGVLADVSLGGLRKDLSLFGELSRIPVEYERRRLYSDTPTPLARIPNTSAFTGGSPDPQWNLIYDQLNVRKRFGTTSGNNLPTVTITSSLPSGFRAGTGSGESFIINRDAQPVNPLAPVIVRCEMMFSFFAKVSKGHHPWEWVIPNAFGGGPEGEKWNHMLHLIYTPMVTLWNPYNVTLRLRQPVIEIANPPVAFRFIRQKSSVPSAIGEVTNRLIPLDEMYVEGGAKFDKKFVMQLFGQVGSDGSTYGDVVLLPGEVRLFSPALDPNWDFVRLFDWQNNLTDRQNYAAQIRAAPGWRGPQYGFNIDWLAGDPSAVISPRNGPNDPLGVIGSRIDDVWDVECGLAPARTKAGANISRYAVSLLTSAGSSSPTSSSTVLSRLEFDFHADPNVLAKAITRDGLAGTKIPFKMSEFSNPELASNIKVGFTDPLKQWIVKPFLVLTAQAKTTSDSVFPSRSWIHNDTSRPISYQSLRDDHQSSNSHELALIRYQNGMATDAKIDANHRGYAFGGSTSLQGSSFFIQRELAIAPIQSVTQLGHFGLASSPFPGAVDHPVGMSFAHPLVRANEYQTGLALDHAWLANTRLWDSWYASTLTNLRGAPFWPRTADLKSVIEGFATNANALPNPRLTPWTAGRSPTELSAMLTTSATEPKTDAFQKSAAIQLLNGAFNVNSTSKAAWMAVLGGLDRETIASLLFNGTSMTIAPNGLATNGPFFSRRRMPANSTAAPNVAHPERFRFWNGGCELTRDELDALAAGIVREVKRRGPFLSLAEFVNRRLGAESDLTLKGAIQAAIDSAPGIGDLNRNAQGLRKNRFVDLSRTITTPDVAGIPYSYPNAALGHSASGAGGSLDQATVLQQIGATISARSDTFRIRAHGDATDASGKVLARAWCEAVVQRLPRYVLDQSENGNAPWDSLASLHPTNLAFGRRFEIRSFRWLTENEI